MPASGAADGRRTALHRAQRTTDGADPPRIYRRAGPLHPRLPRPRGIEPAATAGQFGPRRVRAAAGRPRRARGVRPGGGPPPLPPGKRQVARGFPGLRGNLDRSRPL